MIDKLIVINVTKYYLEVENIHAQRGTIHISEVSNSFIKDLKLEFDIGDIVYAKRIGIYHKKIAYSLKVGHWVNKSFIESGGGFLILENFLKKFEEKENDKIK